MPSRGSIARMMLLVAIFGHGLMIARGWLGPRNDLGEVAPMAIVAVFGLAVCVLADGRTRRFAAGSAATALITSLLFLGSPETSRQAMHRSLVAPIQKAVWQHLVRFGSIPEATMSTGVHTWFWKPHVYTTDRGRFVITNVKDQSVVGLLELPIALAGGLLASIRWRNPSLVAEPPPTDRT